MPTVAISAASAHAAFAATDRFPVSKGPFTPGTKGYLTGTLLAAGVLLAGNLVYASNVLSQINGTNAQIFRIYNTTDAGITNYERGFIGYSGGDFIIGTEAGGTGAQTQLHHKGNAQRFYVGNGNGTFAWLMSSAGHLLGGTDNTYDIGAAGATRPKDLYLGGKLVGSVQSLSGAGAVNLTTYTTALTTTGADALTLADGAVGQIKHIIMVVDGGDGTLTPTNLFNGTTITFDAVGDSVILQFIGTEWHVIAINGATLA